MQVAAVLSHHIGYLPATVALYGLAGTVLVQRISSEQHWASDVWFGAAYGWAAARIVIRLHEGESVRIEPVTVPSGGLGLGIRWTF
jgi:membrane-associated phospholipid phosphatase